MAVTSNRMNGGPGGMREARYLSRTALHDGHFESRAEQDESATI